MYIPPILMSSIILFHSSTILFSSVWANSALVYIKVSLFSHFHPAETSTGMSVGRPRAFHCSFVVSNISLSVFSDSDKGGSC